MAFSLLVLATAACGGGGGSSSVPHTAGPASTLPPGSSATPASTLQTIAMTVVIPKAKSASSTARSPQYIAPNSASMTLTLLSVNGTAASSQTAQGPFNLVAGTGNPNCTGGTTSTTCTFSFAAPVGSDIFLANTYTGANATGSSLGSGAVLLSVRQNASNTANLSLTGPVASVQVVTGTPTLWNGNPVPSQNSSTSVSRAGAVSLAKAHAAAYLAAQSTSRSAAASVRKPLISSDPYPTPAPAGLSSRVFVIALDAVGNQIINPTTFDIPITLTLGLNGTPQGDVALGVQYAGLTTADSGSSSVTGDGQTITIYAPSDIVTLTANSSTTSGSPYAPTIVGSYTPQGGSPQTTPALSFSVFVPPPAALAVLTASHIDPWASGTTQTETFTITNTGTAASSGPLSAYPGAYYSSYVGFAGSDAGWTCYQSEGVYCQTNAVIAPGATSTLQIQFIAGSTSPDDAYFSIYGGGFLNSNSVYVDDTINVTGLATPTPAAAYLQPVAGGDPVFYSAVNGTLTVGLTNAGGSTTSGTTTLTNTLPTNFAYNSFTGTGWSCSGSAPTITCTTAQTVAPAATYPPLSLSVAPPQALPSSAPFFSVSATGGNASPVPQAASTGLIVDSPVYFDSAPGFAIGQSYGNGFTPGGTATSTDALLDIGASPPSPGPLSGSVSITTKSSASGTYHLTSDNCTGSVIDGIFASHFPQAAATAGTGLTVPLDINFMNGNASCLLTITDSLGNTANLTVGVGNTQITVQGHRKAGGSR